MHIVDKLNIQLDSMIEKIQILNNEKDMLLEHVKNLQAQHDALKKNNENMLINIDKALKIANAKNKG